MENKKDKKLPFAVLRKGAIAGVLGLTMGLSCFCLTGCSDGKDGQNGKDGAQWYSGIETPTTQGVNGDFYLDTDDYILYQKTNGEWTVLMRDFGKPATATNIELQVASDKVQWRYTTGDDTVWKDLIDVETITGTDGKDGREIELQVGSEYIQWRYTTGEDTAWKNLMLISSLKGTDGATWLSGTTEPTTTQGKNGDFYLNESNYDIYKKTDGVWNKIGNIKGEKGKDGIAGSEINQLTGKSILAIGDSYVAGHTSPDSDTWISQLATRNNMTKYVYAQNGISIAHPTTAISNGLVDMIDTITSSVSTTDYIVFLAGHNDANASLNGGTAVPIGTNEDKTKETYKGSLNMIIESLLNKYPTAKILFLTPFERYGTEEAYATAMQEVCAKWSIPCFDNYHNSGICWQNEAQKAAYESANLHFNQAGHERISYMYESILKNNCVIGSYVNDKEPEESAGWLSEFGHPTGSSEINRAIVTIKLYKGQTIDFANKETWATYKYAIGPGTDQLATTWIKDSTNTSSSYQTGGSPCEIPSTGTYTIMIARQDNSTITTSEMETFKSLFKIN